MRSPQREAWLESLHKRERNNFVEGVQYRRVRRIDAIKTGRSIVDTKIVCKIKGTSSEKFFHASQLKVRMTARGFQQKSSEIGRTFSPCPSTTSSRVFTLACLHHGWTPSSADVSGAYLQGIFKQHERVFVVPPPEWEEDPDYVWELLRSMYGLKSAGRVWSDLANEFMLSLEFRGAKFQVSKNDPCVFYWRNRRGILGAIIELHVDDWRIGGRPAVSRFIKQELSKKWKCTFSDRATRHLGINYTYAKDGSWVEIDQHDKVHDILADFNMLNARGANVPCVARGSKATEPITPEEEFFMRDKDYNKGVGDLLWLSRQTRPDLEWITNHLSQFLSDPRPQHWKLFIDALRYLNSHRYYVLRFTKPSHSSRPITFTDSDFAPKQSEQRRSTSGRVSIFGGAALSWKSRKQNCTATSSAEAELVALADGTTESVWLRRFLQELDMFPSDEPLTIKVDNNACKEIANNRMLSQRIKHIDTRYFAVRDYIKNGTVSVSRVDTSLNTSDIFTKPLAKNKFRQFRKDLGVVPSLFKRHFHS
jgi:hypothetical protein